MAERVTRRQLAATGRETGLAPFDAPWARAHGKLGECCRDVERRDDPDWAQLVGFDDEQMTRLVLRHHVRRPSERLTARDQDDGTARSASRRMLVEPAGERGRHEV